MNCIEQPAPQHVFQLVDHRSNRWPLSKETWQDASTPCLGWKTRVQWLTLTPINWRDKRGCGTTWCNWPCCHLLETIRTDNTVLSLKMSQCCGLSRKNVFLSLKMSWCCGLSRKNVFLYCSQCNPVTPRCGHSVSSTMGKELQMQRAKTAHTICRTSHLSQQHLLSPVNASYKRWSAYTCPPLIRGRNWANGLSWIAPG